MSTTTATLANQTVALNSPDLSQIQKYWDAIRLPGEIVELRYRAPYVDKQTGETKNRYYGERCDSPEKLAEAVSRIDPTKIYWVNIQKMKQDTPFDFYGTLANADMECFRWFVAETDPERLDATGEKIGGVTATDSEKEQSTEVSNRMYDLFKSFGTDPAVIDSGNGRYALVAIDLPNTPENCGLIKRATYGLKAKFSTAVVKVDSTSANIGRVLGLPGTMNAKGPDTPERPHRMRQLLLPGSRDVLLTVAQLEEIAAWAPVKVRTQKSNSDSDEQEEGPFTFENVEELFEKLEKRTQNNEKPFTYEPETTIAAGDGWNVRCPHYDAHTLKNKDRADDLDRSTSVWMTDRGFPVFRCLHDGDDKQPCGTMGWHEFIAEWCAEDLQKEITAQTTYPWPDPSDKETKYPREGTVILFQSRSARAEFRGRVKETPAWEFAAEWPDRDDISTFHWPEYETWVKTVATTAATAQGEFKFPKIPGKVEDYLLLPRFHDFDGWAGRGRTHIIAGSSGSGKTTLMAPLLLEQWQGKTIFGHVGARLRPLVIFADRGELSNEETLRRLGLSNSSLPICHLSDAVDDLAIHEILKMIEKQSPLPEVVYLEGADELVSKASEGATVSRFMNGLKKISGHYHISFILSVGAPKSKPKDQHALIRDRVFGSEKWVRKSDMILSMMAVGDGTGKESRLTVQYRNAPAEKFELEFQNGRLVEKEFLESSLAPDPLEMWATKREQEQGKTWFTRPEAVVGLEEFAGMSRTKVHKKILDLIIAKKLVSRSLKNPAKNLTEEFRFVGRPGKEKQAPVASNPRTTKE